MQLDNSFATQKWNSNLWGCKFIQCRSIFIFTCIITCISSRHVLVNWCFWTVFLVSNALSQCTCQILCVSFVANKFKFFFQSQKKITQHSRCPKERDILYLWLFVCCKYQYSDSGILNAPAEHLLFYLKIIWVALRKDMFSSISHTCISCIFIVYFCTCSLVCNNIAIIWAMFRSP